MRKPDERIATLYRDGCKAGARILQWKYDVVRRAILDAVPRRRAGLSFRQLAEAVRGRISEHERRRIGSLNWYLVTVKLDLEARGEIRRIDIPGSQILRRT